MTPPESGFRGDLDPGLIRDLALVLEAAARPRTNLPERARRAMTRLQPALGVTPGELAAGYEDRLAEALGHPAPRGDSGPRQTWLRSLTSAVALMLYDLNQAVMRDQPVSPVVAEARRDLCALLDVQQNDEPPTVLQEKLHAALHPGAVYVTDARADPQAAPWAILELGPE